MKEFRKGKNCKEHYTSFEELREGFGLSPLVKRTKNEEKLQQQRERFANKHLCKSCKKPMSYIGGTVMTCTNETCKGIREERIDKDGNVIVTYSISYDLLDNKGASIAANIFD